MISVHGDIVRAKRAFDRCRAAAFVLRIADREPMATRRDLPEDATRRFLARLQRDERRRRVVIDEDDE